MTFLERVLDRLAREPQHAFLTEAREEGWETATGAALLGAVRRVRAFARENGLRKGDRCAVLARNSAAWAAVDLGLLAEGVLVVPLFGRQRPAEIARILKDCRAAVFLSDDADLAGAALGAWPEGPAPRSLDDALSAPEEHGQGDPVPLAPEDPVALLYTSGTSGDPKGVVLTRANVDFVLERTIAVLDRLMDGCPDRERTYHYLPWCFAGAWIALLACLVRGAAVTVNMDAARIVEDLRAVRPHWFQNVPLVLDRIREGVERGIAGRGGLIAGFFSGALRAGREIAAERSPSWLDGVKLTVCRRAVFPRIRDRLGADLRALVCGSAPLAPRTQIFFETLGIPVLQVYGLTETTAICTLDEPGTALAGRVGGALAGVEMRADADGEILVRGPNVFAGYWERPEDTARALRDGWLATGDRGEMNEDGSWRILGRTGSILVLGSGHNVAPEPIESALAERLPGAHQVVLAGPGRPYVVAVVTGDVQREDAARAIATVNADLPPYQRVRGSLLLPTPFDVGSGLLTATGKVRREAVLEKLAGELDGLYAHETVGA